MCVCVKGVGEERVGLGEGSILGFPDEVSKTAECMII